MKKTRRKSGGKRTSVRTKKVIQKKKKAFRDKARKQIKRMRAMGIKPRKINRNTLAVPNLCPFKEELLKRALKDRDELKEELILKKALKKERKNMVNKALKFSRKQINAGLVVPKSLRSTSWYFDESKDSLLLPSMFGYIVLYIVYILRG